MRLEFVGKNIDITEALKNQAEKKFSKLDKYFSEEIEGKVTFQTVKGQHKTEVTVFLPGNIMRAEEATHDMYASMDLAVSALERQIRKYKTRLKKRYKNNETIRFDNFEQSVPEDEEDTQGQIVTKRKSFHLSPMDEKEAVLQMELLNHNFFIYLDRDTDNTNVLYRRKDGNYGLIEIEE
ncbi:ribosome-associated translation inhibitor RaiA [Peptoniphilus sp. KCTC 25270]|uniref:ribosome hibernation-promoting factor, HPF/YfiA family n=1 Tax=Peptoniphilus sp. KCTC 25270 TaxID=2897414 RepID=UPI001E382C36|nr:ribosome-associated translation inhibitor RaiA [Peptoniphilus sp. KCTC 25270]MCD1147253.1 ribosome-associated translation inhibitor RaiA [Peptoniphilus sp. KCTC 25270]